MLATDIYKVLLIIFLIQIISCNKDGLKHHRIRSQESEHINRHPRSNKKPNIILFLTDDQDIELGSLSFMPKTLKNIRNHGAEFRHAYVTTPMCCPSRSSLLTGLYVHNHHVFTNKDNCSSTQWQAMHETRSYATYLSNAGYRTGYFGKYLNKYNGSYIPPGWREWGGLIMNSKYYNYSINMNGKKIKHGFEYDKDYYTDLIANDSITFLRNSKKQFPNKPLMLTMAFPAPHGPEDSAPQYSELFFNITTHHTPSYDFAPNPDKQWILKVTNKMKPVYKEFTNLLMTKRLQTLQSVDTAVERVVEELKALGELENTYLIYTSDHGYHLGQFGLIKGKSFPFEFDVRVPLLVRGPGIEAGATLREIVLNIDMAPTFLDMADIDIPPHMDGRSFLPLFQKTRRKKSRWRDTFLLESSGRRETPFLNAKLQQEALLQYSVPVPSELKKRETTDKTVPKTRNSHFNESLEDNSVTKYENGGKAGGNFKNQMLQDYDFDEDTANYDGKLHFGIKRYKHKEMALLEEKSAKNGDGKLITSGRMTFKCFFDYSKLPCRKGQKWFCQLDKRGWRRYKCKNGERNYLPKNESKNCACFTSSGLIYATSSAVAALPKRHNYKPHFCFCGEKTSVYSSDNDDNQPTEEEKRKIKRQKKKEEECHYERMTCFEHNNDHWRTEPKWNMGPFCFCMNANNNTYSCLRTINYAHNFLYCEFTTGLITYYNLRIDPFELQNRYSTLKHDEKVYLKNLLKRLVACKGMRNCTSHLDSSRLHSHG